jgi:RNA polymerase sigma-70 factor, ECF subfamily
VVGVGPTRLNGAAGSASDAALAARAAALGDADAFETLMRRHERRIYHLLLRFTRNAALAEDLCQDTFLRAWRKLRTFQGSGSFAGWLARLAYHVFLAQHRLARTAAETTMADAGAVEPVMVVSGCADEVPDLDRLLAVVSPDEQNLLILSYAAGLSASEIGEMLGLSSGTVKSQIHRAKHKIRQHFAIGAPP